MNQQYKKIWNSLIVLLIVMITSCSSDEPSNVVSIDCDFHYPSALTTSASVYGDYKTILLQNCEIYDDINDLTWLYNVLLPIDFSPTKQYPVLYLLHGRTYDHNSWIKSLSLRKVSELYNKLGLLDIIIVMPYADKTYYLNDYQDEIKYETFFFDIFIPFIENEYPVIKDAESRYIGGFSMGGYGACYYMLTHPGKFSFCFAASCPMDGRNIEKTPPVIDYIKNTEKDKIPTFIFEVGKDDSFADCNVEFHSQLNEMSINHEFIMREGEHDNKFWKNSIYVLFDRLAYEINSRKN